LVAQAKVSAANRVQNQRIDDLSRINSLYPDATLTSSGLRYIIKKEGTGEKPSAGRTVFLNYKGSFLSGEVFDSSDVQGQPLNFPVGTGEVIQGFDDAAMDMRIGEKRVVIIPPELAYGSAGAGGVIPPNSFLVFELELLGIN